MVRLFPGLKLLQHRVRALRDPPDQVEVVVLSSGLQQEGQEEERNQARAGESLVCYLTVPSALQKLGISR